MRHRSVAADANFLTEFDRAAWHSRAAGTGFLYSTFAFDRASGVTVAFGGYGFFFVDAGTREWNGSSWTLRTPLASPPGRGRAAMAFDRVRARIVLFGGHDGALVKLGDTWEYDGTTWVLAATTGPAARTNHAMTWDPQRRVVVLYGGLTGTWTDDTWEWDGSTWTQSSPGPSAVPSVLAYDEARNVAVLLATQPFPATTSTWERVGTNWIQRQATSPLSTQSGGCFDEVLGRVIAFGADGSRQASTWSWDGATWQALTNDPVPPVVEGVAMAPCPLRGSLLRHGTGPSAPGSALTWEWASEWRLVPTATSPGTSLVFPALASEPGGTVLLFGGAVGGVPNNASWRFTGTDWTPLSPGNAPAPRSQHGMALDPARARVVLFGGLSAGNAPLGDTWEWDGANWTQMATAIAPSARANPAMAYDPAAGVLLFGGGIYNASGTAQADFWRWNGTTWQAIPAGGGPTARARATMTFDPVRQRTVVTGGFAAQLLATTAVAGTWEWDGASWANIGGAQVTPSLGFAGGFDPVAGRVIAYTQASFGAASVWQLGAPSVAATATFGSACTGSSGEPSLTTSSTPRQGNPVFGLRAVSLLPGTAVLFGLAAASANVPLGGGCSLLVDSPLLALLPADLAGVAELPLPLPASSSLHGASFVAQAAGYDPSGPFAQLVITAALAITID
ncbi:MAG: hypothetical protein JNL08_19060 [Planctomycetes bacterium]|nr:hypothetical protein [Planctomycetota bacterium]